MRLEGAEAFLNNAAIELKDVPGNVIVIQAFGDFLGFNLHPHVLIFDGCFHEDGMLSVTPAIVTNVLEKIYHKK